MNTKKYIYRTLALVALSLSGFGLTSCDSFLEITPMNTVVLENFWTKRSDAISSLMGCYESLQSDDNINRMGMWGEIRSDNIKMGTGISYELEEILKENILSTNTICKWGSFYQTINRCNTFCHYAPVVEGIDPNYTETEMKANIAEAVAIRSLCYFYLARTFRDVPFTRQASISDEQEYRVPATPFNDVLDSLIVDLESVKDDAVRRYYDYENVDEYHNSARVTRYFIYALLADIYLWKGNYDKCIEYGQLIVDYKQQQYKDLVSRYGNDTKNHIKMFGDFPLITEYVGDANPLGNAYREIFGESSSHEFKYRTTHGNSFESIFELSFRNRDNKYVFDNFCTSASSYAIGRLRTCEEFCGGLPSDDGKLFKKTDCRAYESIDCRDINTHGIRKYVMDDITGMDRSKSISKIDDVKASKRTDKHANWIVYRLTDVMLMMAEAYAEKGDVEKAFNICNVVNSRANYKDVADDYTGGSLDKAEYATQETVTNLVFEERHRELIFEGKRWYDLVRYSLRTGNTKKLASEATLKQIVDASSVRIRLSDMNMIFLPYFRDELKVNPYLKQNPAYNKGIDDDMKTN
ncbi:MAG: RagB/SusD family nutrient uptake outer membrane protein [Prevotella sp.]|nr:RagB/SusD family nutrient uptake outer membrane protein [Candidatus Prevotella equi]